jgi:hypothetical protein
MIRQKLKSRGQDLLVGSQTISKLLFTQYSIYIYKVIFTILAISCAWDKHLSKRDECGGVTCASTCPKRRNINIVI